MPKQNANDISQIKNLNTPKKSKKHNLSSSSNSNSSGGDLLLHETSASNYNSAKSLLTNQFTMSNRVDLATKLLENNSDLVLNCVQLINFIDFYFNEAQSVMSHESTDSTSTQRSITACFPCIVCSMQFSFDQTFHTHLERRSVVIRVFCTKCDSLKKFYNKCKLLYHVYSHKLTLFDAIYKSIQIESLAPVELASSRTNLTSLQTAASSKERNIDIDLIFSNVFQAGFDADYASDLAMLNVFNNGFKVCENDLVQIQLFIKRLVISNYLVYKCHVCDAIFFHLKELKQHYATSQRLEFATLENTQSDTIKNANRAYFQSLKQKQTALLASNRKLFKNLYSSSSYYLNADDKLKIDLFVNNINSFSFKKLQFSNRCYTLAAQNMLYSETVAPTNESSVFCMSSRSNLDENLLICPECGLSFDAKTQADSFRLHLVYECLFTIKYSPFQIKCPLSACKCVFDNLDGAISHWSSNHVLKQHQCDLCDRKGNSN